MTIKQQYKLAYSITRLAFKLNDTNADKFFASWALWGIPTDVGIAALLSYRHKLD